MNSQINGAPRIAFLGVCERGSFVMGTHPLLSAQHIIGLKRVIAGYLFPLVLDGTQFVFSIYEPETFQPVQVNFRSEDDTLVLGFTLGITVKTESNQSNLPQPGEESIVIPQALGWMTLFYRVENIGAIVAKPGRLRAMLAEAGEEVCIGTLDLVGIWADPLTQDRIEAIRSDPLAIKTVRIAFSCKLCGSGCRSYAGLERNPAMEAEGWTWYSESPGEFSCPCGETKIDLSYVQRNLHILLVTQASRPSEVSITRLYEKSTLQEVARSFGQLLDAGTSEEVVHDFMKNNPILVNQFSPARVRHKAPVLTRYKTDIAILDQRGILHLVELERPGIKLMKQDGGIASELQHAFDQVRDWLEWTKREWGATLRELGFNPEEVSRVMGVVIAGCDKGYPTEHLAKLKGSDFGSIEFYTYDDLLSGLLGFIRTIDAL